MSINKPLLAIFIFISFFAKCFAQPVGFDIAVDNIGNVYTVDNDNIYKFNNVHEQTARFSFKKYGLIASIDVSNPLKIIVFFKEFGQLLFLDNTLSITHGPVSLYDMQLSDPKLMCRATDNSLWVYDNQDFSLKKYNTQLELQLEISNLPNLTGYMFNPSLMLVNDAYTYLVDSVSGIYVFDRYGTFNKRIPILGATYLNITNSFIVYYLNGSLRVFNRLTFTDKELFLIRVPFKALAFDEKYVYYLNTKGNGYIKESLLQDFK